MHYRNKNKNGFTLIELLVVIAIIGILMGIVLFAVRRAHTKAQIAAAQAKIYDIMLAVHDLEIDNECWPKRPDEAVCKTPNAVEQREDNEIWDLNDLQVGILGDDDNAFLHWNGPYMNRVPDDPWGNAYFFDTDYDLDYSEAEQWGVVIGSFGPNGVQGDDDDVIYQLAGE